MHFIVARQTGFFCRLRVELPQAAQPQQKNHCMRPCGNGRLSYCSALLPWWHGNTLSLIFSCLNFAQRVDFFLITMLGCYVSSSGFACVMEPRTSGCASSINHCGCSTPVLCKTERWPHPRSRHDIRPQKPKFKFVCTQKFDWCAEFVH